MRLRDKFKPGSKWQYKGPEVANIATLLTCDNAIDTGDHVTVVRCSRLGQRVVVECNQTFERATVDPEHLVLASS